MDGAGAVQVLDREGWHPAQRGEGRGSAGLALSPRHVARPQGGVWGRVSPHQPRWHPGDTAVAQGDVTCCGVTTSGDPTVCVLHRGHRSASPPQAPIVVCPSMSLCHPWLVAPAGDSSHPLCPCLQLWGQPCCPRGCQPQGEDTGHCPHSGHPAGTQRGLRVGAPRPQQLPQWQWWPREPVSPMERCPLALPSRWHRWGDMHLREKGGWHTWPWGCRRASVRPCVHPLCASPCARCALGARGGGAHGWVGAVLPQGGCWWLGGAWGEPPTRQRCC